MAGYQVLYRKYRPRFFADVVGQPQVTVTLKSELTRGRIAHAYLFTGSRGTGKTTCAKILSRAVNCLNPQDGDPCGECEVCRGLEDGSILDVVEIDAASNNGVDSIRSLIEESNFTPASAKYRVYIIDEVHMLSVAAFNALLKTLEEPPPHVIFILATTEVHKLLPTILSRCQRFDFKRIAPEDIADRLEWVASQEGVEIDREAGLLIARISDGAMRDALSLLDQCLGHGSHVTLETVNETAGVAARDYLSSLAQNVAEGNAARALATIDALHRQSKDMSRLCGEMAEYFRGLMLIKTMKDASRLVSADRQELETMTEQALSMNLSAILHGLDTFEETLNKMRYLNPRAQLEMAFVRLCSPELDSTPEALIRRLEALESGAPKPVVRRAPQPEPEGKPFSAETPEQPTQEQPKLEQPKQEQLKQEQPRPEESRPEPPQSQEALPEEPLEAPLPQEPPEPEMELPPEPPVFDSAPLPAEQPERQPPTPAPAAPKPPEKPAVDIKALSANAQRFLEWPEILQVIKNSTKSVAMAFEGSSAYISGDYMLIEAPEIAFEFLKRSEQRERMREAIRAVTGRVYKLGPYRKGGPEEEQEDPLEALARRAQESGIDVSEEMEDEPEQEPLSEEQIPF